MTRIDVDPGAKRLFLARCVPLVVLAYLGCLFLAPSWSAGPGLILVPLAVMLTWNNQIVLDGPKMVVEYTLCGLVHRDAIEGAFCRLRTTSLGTRALFLDRAGRFHASVSVSERPELMQVLAPYFEAESRGVSSGGRTP